MQTTSRANYNARTGQRKLTVWLPVWAIDRWRANSDRALAKYLRDCLTAAAEGMPESPKEKEERHND
jgi:hypothetical protein